MASSYVFSFVLKMGGGVSSTETALSFEGAASSSSTVQLPFTEWSLLAVEESQMAEWSRRSQPACIWTIILKIDVL